MAHFIQKNEMFVIICRFVHKGTIKNCFSIIYTAIERGLWGKQKKR